MAIRTEELILNMGPQHPSTHGVLHVLLKLNGEVVVDAQPSIGYIHRSIEKLVENRLYYQCMPLICRLDYLAALSNEFAFVRTVEELLGISIPERAEYIRVVMAELARIASHLVWLGTFGLDLGAMTPFLYCFREREEALDLIEMATGSRMMSNYMRVGGVKLDLPADFFDAARSFADDFVHRVDEYEQLLTTNEVFLVRTKGIGVLTKEEAINLGVTGPILRASGQGFDLRKNRPYSVYDRFDFEIAVAENGDCYDRYLVRIKEMRESARIVRQGLDSMPEGTHILHAPKLVLPPKDELKISMESLIHHFELIVKGMKPPAGEIYSSIESPRGELGFYLISDGSPKPYRLKIRAPSFVNLQALPAMIKGMMIGDVVAIIGSLDIVLGEIDR
jgi:NADH-quinone oxidoreductase subunit D